MADEELMVLGSGCGVPDARRGAPGFLLRGAGLLALLDAGPGTLHRAAAAGFAPRDIDLVIVTHLHLDHVAEIPYLLFALRIPYGAPRSRPLVLVGPPGFGRHYGGLREAYGESVAPLDYELALLEAGAGTHALKGLGLDLEAWPMTHTDASVGYRIATPGGRVVALSGDTDLCPEAATLGQGADLLILECSMPEGEKTPGHLIPSEAGRIAQEARCRRLLLAHFYPHASGADAVRRAAREFDGDIIAAEDGMRIAF